MSNVKVSLATDTKSKKEFDDVMVEIAREVANDIFFFSQENLVKPDNDGHIISDRGTSGGLAGSGNLFVTDTGAEVIYSAPHAEPVETGTIPHMPPVEPLIKWAQRKLRNKKVVNGEEKNVKLTGKEAQSTGWAIAMKIKKEGTPARRYIRNAIDSATVKWERKGVNVILKP